MGETSPEPVRIKISRPLRSKRLLAVVVIVIATTGFAVTAYAFHLFGLGTASCASRPTNGPNSAYFTVIMSGNGYNDSKINGLPRPVMNVTRGESVRIHLVNNDPTEDHGFTITHYFANGIILSPGKCYDVTFTADQLGTFRVFCQIFCLPHIPWMQNGQFNVNP